MPPRSRIAYDTAYEHLKAAYDDGQRLVSACYLTYSERERDGDAIYYLLTEWDLLGILL